jgi:flavodoxin
MAAPRILIVYYSRSGTTRRIADSLAAALKCDIEEITEPRSRTGLYGYLRSLVEARQKRPSTIAPAKRNASSYDLIVVGTPVWAWSVSSPVRAYLTANKTRLPEVAFFCTLGGAGNKTAFAQMQELSGKVPRALCAITAREVSAGGFAPRLAEFAKEIQQSAPPTKPIAIASDISALRRSSRKGT